MSAKHQGKPRGRTDGLVAVGELESQAAGGQFIKIWSPGMAVPITSECWFEVINQQEQDIRAVAGLFTGSRCRSDKDRAGNEKSRDGVKHGSRLAGGAGASPEKVVSGPGQRG